MQPQLLMGQDFKTPSQPDSREFIPLCYELNLLTRTLDLCVYNLYIYINIILVRKIIFNENISVLSDCIQEFLLNGALCPLKRPDDRFQLHVAKSETGQLTDPQKSAFSENTRSP